MYTCAIGSLITGFLCSSLVVTMSNSVLVIWDVAEIPLRDLSVLLRTSKRWALYHGSDPPACLASLAPPDDEVSHDAESR